MLSKDELLSAIKTRFEEVDVDGLEGKLRIRVMSGHGRDAFQEILKEKGISDSAYFGALIVSCVVDEAGKPMFTESDVEVLREGHAELIRQIGIACQRVNGLGKVAQEAAAKN